MLVLLLINIACRVKQEKNCEHAKKLELLIGKLIHNLKIVLMTSCGARLFSEGEGEQAWGKDFYKGADEFYINPRPFLSKSG